MNTLEVILDKMMLYGSKIENPLLHNYYSQKYGDWIHNEPVTISELRKRSFFKRFTADDLQPFVSRMKVIHLKTN